MTVDLKKTVPVITGLIAIVAAMFAIDARYLQTAAAGEIFDKQARNREEGDLQTQLDLARLELDFWMRVEDGDERRFKIEYLREKIGRIEKRLQELDAQG